MEEIKKKKEEFSIFCRIGDEIKFRENFIFKISKSENEESFIEIGSDDLNEYYSDYKKSKNISSKNKNNPVWALSQRVLLNTSSVYGKESFSNKVNLISSFGYTEKNNQENFVDKMHEEIFNNFDYICRNNDKKINVLCIPAIGLGVFNGDPDIYWKSMFSILSKNENLCKKINEGNAFIFYNPGSKMFEWNKFIDEKENEEKKLIVLIEKDIFDFAYQIKEGKIGKHFEVSILNPSNKHNLISVKSLGCGGFGEGNINFSTSIRLNDFFEEIYLLNKTLIKIQPV